jgi:hypothetical protein
VTGGEVVFEVVFGAEVVFEVVFEAAFEIAIAVFQEAFKILCGAESQESFFSNSLSVCDSRIVTDLLLPSKR